jgi:hypothetical protein
MTSKKHGRLPARPQNDRLNIIEASTETIKYRLVLIDQENEVMKKL